MGRMKWAKTRDEWQEVGLMKLIPEEDCYKSIKINRL